MPNVRTKFLESYGLILDIVSLDGLCVNFARCDGPVKYEVACDKTRSEIVCRECSKCQIISGEGCVLQFVQSYGAVNNMFS